MQITGCDDFGMKIKDVFALSQILRVIFGFN